MSQKLKRTNIKKVILKYFPSQAVYRKKILLY